MATSSSPPLWKSFPLFHLSFFLTFFISGLLVDILQFLLYFLLSSTNFRRVNQILIWILHSQLLFIADWWANLEIKLHVLESQRSDTEYFGNEHALVILNHHYETDWIFGWMIADRYKVLGNARVFLKDVLKFVPVFGWAWSFAEVIFLKRNWNEDKTRIEIGLQRLQEFPNPMWLTIFAEGTRFTPQKYEASLKFITSHSESSFPKLKHHLLPRTRGFVHTLQNVNSEKIKAVYDCCLVIHSDNLTVFDLMLGVSGKADMFMRRIQISDIDTSSPESISSFLYTLYEEKDALKDNFLTFGSFSNSKSKIQTVEFKGFPPRRIASLLNVALLNCLISFPLVFELGKILYFGSMLQRNLVLLVGLLLAFLLHIMLNYTKVSKSSSYGSGAKAQ